MPSNNDWKRKETLDGVVVEYRPRTQRRLSPGRSAGLMEDRIHLRLPLEDLHCGAWVSTREGNAQRLWVVEAINGGAGDGCIELTLAPMAP